MNRKLQNINHAKKLFKEGKKLPDMKITDARFIRLPKFSIDNDCNINVKESAKVVIFRGNSYEEYFTVKHFKCDGASIPQSVRNVCSKYKFCNAGIVHDWLYMVGALTRKECDLIFYYLAKNNNKIWTSTAWLAYKSVRACGSRFYKGSSKNKSGFLSKL